LGKWQENPGGKGTALMHFKWILFIASRYIFSKQKKSPSPVLSILGIATGVFALIVIIAVMNGFQLGFIESIVELSSYHLRVGPVDAEKTEEARMMLLTIPEVVTAVPFQEFQALARGRRGGQQAALVRGVPNNALSLDAGMAGRLEFEKGSFDLSDEKNALIGSELSQRLGITVGDSITLFSIPSIFSAAANDAGESGIQSFMVKGVFRTGFYEYDTSWVFIGMESAATFCDTGPVLGLKLKNRFQDQRGLDIVKRSCTEIPLFEKAIFSSWRDYNRSFFGALRTEKLFMFILVGLIFIVVGLNIYQAQRRAVLEHREEIGLLRAIGGAQRAVRLIFVCDGAIIGLSGALAGLCLGLLVATNIPQFFTIIENIMRYFVNVINFIANYFNNSGVDDFTIFSPAVFYIKEIPSRIIPREVVFIFLFGFFSALLAAWFASRKITHIQAAEVLRYE
jgi:lipoprotein-releasing system permease protein